MPAKRAADIPQAPTVTVRLVWSALTEAAMPIIGQPRPIPELKQLPRPLYARAESMGAGSWTTRHQHDWVQFSYAISGVLGVYTDAGSYFAPPQWGVWIPADAEHAVVT